MTSTILRATWVYWIGLVVTAIAYVLIMLEIIPSIPEMFDYLETGLDSIGLWLLFPLAVLENIYGFTVFFPGGIVILSGMATTTGDPVSGFIALFYIHFGTQLGYLCTYALVGFVRSNAFTDATTRDELAPIPLIRKGVLMLWHPLLGSTFVAELAASKTGYLKVVPYLFVINGIYNIFWAGIIYFAGNFLRSESNALLLVFVGYLFYMIGFRSYRLIFGAKTL